jgi:hypothetical protein
MELKKIKEHLKEVGYTKSAQKNIRFFLLGKGLIDALDEITVVDSRGIHSFEDFHTWFINETDPLSQRVHIENKADGAQMDVTVGLLLSILNDTGLFKITPLFDCEQYLNDNEEVKEVNDYITVHGYSPIMEGELDVYTCPECVAQQLRELGYDVKSPL